MRLLRTDDVAEMLAASPEFVRSHAAELGGVRLGGHPKGPLRFDPAQVEAWVAGQRLERPTVARRRRPGRVQAADFELLPWDMKAA